MRFYGGSLSEWMQCTIQTLAAMGLEMRTIQARESLMWNARIQIGNGLAKKSDMKTYLDGLQKAAGIKRSKGLNSGMRELHGGKITANVEGRLSDTISAEAWMGEDQS